MASGQEVGGRYANLGAGGLGAGFVNVMETPYNAAGDGAEDDTLAIQAALDSGAGSPVVVYFPPGTYKVCPRPNTGTFPGNDCLRINYNNVILVGAGRFASTISCYVAGGLSPVTHWEVITVNGTPTVWRGNGIRLASNPISGLSISGLRVTGNQPRDLTTFPVWGPGTQGGTAFPADVNTGLGWDMSNKGVFVGDGGAVNNVTIADCEIDSFGGEIIYYGGDGLTNLLVHRCVMHDTLASAFCCGGGLTLEDSEIYYSLNGIEETPLDKVQVIQRNHIHDNVHGVSIPSNAPAPTGGLGRCICRSNRLVKNWQWGFYVQGAIRGFWMVDNEITDHPNYGALLLGSFAAGGPRDVTIERNVVRCETYGDDLNSFVFNSDLGFPCKNIRVVGNRTERSQTAIDAGHLVLAPIGFRYDPDSTIHFSGNDWSGGDPSWEPLQPYPGNLLWVDGTTADTHAPSMDFCGSTALKLVPASAQTYTAWSDAPSGLGITVELNANATITASSTVKLDGGVSFAPGGTGGIITFMRPAGSSVVYEVKRFAY